HCRSRTTLKWYALSERLPCRAAAGYGGVHAAEGLATALEKGSGQYHPRAGAARRVTAAGTRAGPGPDGAVWSQGFRDGLPLCPVGWHAPEGGVPPYDPPRARSASAGRALR